MNRIIRLSCSIMLAALVAAGATLPAEAAKARSSGRSNVNQNKNVNRNTSANRNTNVNKNTNINKNTNVNRNTNVNIDRDVDIDIDVDHHHGGYPNGCCYHDNYNPLAVVAAVAITAAVVGSIVYTLPPSCTVIIRNGFAYQQCGNVWYQPQISGSSTTYIVVNAPY